MKKYRYIAVIPARSGSKGLKNKNIKIMQGKPLIYWSIKAGMSSNLIERVIVSTDSNLYANIAKKYGAEVPFLRPKKISKDNSTDYEFFTHVIKKLKLTEDCLLINLRPTTPYREQKVLTRAISIFNKNLNYFSSLRSIHKMSESSFKTFTLNENRISSINKKYSLESANKPRQSFSDTYQANGYIDILKVSHIMKNKNLYGNNCYGFLTKTSYEIDNLEDFKLIEKLGLLNK